EGQAEHSSLGTHRRLRAVGRRDYGERRTKSGRADQTATALHRNHRGDLPTVDHTHYPCTGRGRVSVSRLRVFTREHRSAHCTGLCHSGENFGTTGEEGLSSSIAVTAER